MKQKPSVVSLHIAPAARAPMVAVAQIRAIPGRGLEGDRYFNQIGTFSKNPGGGREVTLIEAEAIEALRRDYEIELDGKDSRRNIVTRGVALNHLVGREFRVGPVALMGIRLCEPCNHLDRLVETRVSPGLLHRGGLRADILTEGVICRGDLIEI
jgi:MOSC domain-containing protein YiiM